MDEFAMGSSTENSAYGPTRNPFDTDRVPGGSSGGSAAAVAARFAPLSVGTDTGGSIRLPATFCGVVGMKATYGVISRRGVVPLSFTLDHAGPLTRSVEDCALAMQVLAGYDPGDPGSAREAVPDYSADLRKGVAGLTIGRARAYDTEAGVDAEVMAAVGAAAEQWRALGDMEHTQ
jgi:aspartyl-tRNA(Asn)/glutamyl-tRNA(Gln) amidotransferase subunit A